MNDALNHTRMTIGQHLEELRWHVLKAVGYFFVAFAVCFYFQDPLMEVATWPHRRVGEKLKREARLQGSTLDVAKAEQIDRITEADKALKALFDHVERRDAELRERYRPDPERLSTVEEELEALEGEARALSERQEELLASGDLEGEELDALTEAREGLVARYTELHGTVDREVRPLIDRNAKAPNLKLQQIKYQEAFLTALKLSLVAALLVGSPLIVWELWSFVGKGLYDHEKRLIRLFYPFSITAFACGVLFGYFLLIPLGLEFLITYGDRELITGNITVGDYLSLFIGLTLVVGLVFELPLAMTFVSMVGILKPEHYREYRRYFILVAFIAGALLTPPDPVTQTLMAVPIIVLYELGIWCASLVGRGRRGPDDAPDPPETPSTPAPPPPATPSLGTSAGAPEVGAPEAGAPEVGAPEVGTVAEAPAAVPLIRPPEGPQVARGAEPEEVPEGASEEAPEETPGEAPAEPVGEEAEPPAEAVEEAPQEEEELDIGDDSGDQEYTGYFDPEAEDEEWEDPYGGTPEGIAQARPDLVGPSVAAGGTKGPEVKEPEAGEPESGEPESGEPESGEPESGEPEGKAGESKGETPPDAT